MLATSFGEAGAEIVARNMRNCQGIAYDFPGRTTVAVFAHVKIHRFSEMAEYLRDQIVPLANAVGLQVHLAAALSGGSANRIVGGEFQIVWRFPEDIDEEDLARCIALGAPIVGADVSNVADGALLSAVRAIVVRARSRRARCSAAPAASAADARQSCFLSITRGS